MLRMNKNDINCIRFVACVRRRGKNIHPHVVLSIYVSIWQIQGDKKFLSLITEKLEWESSSSILITRNPNCVSPPPVRSLLWLL
jgi:hypothetical protein